MWRRSESVRGLIPGQACSSSVNRRGPSERSWTISDVHFWPIRSAQAATAQVVPSCTSRMDLSDTEATLLRAPAHFQLRRLLRRPQIRLDLLVAREGLVGLLVGDGRG